MAGSNSIPGSSHLLSRLICKLIIAALFHSFAHQAGRNNQHLAYHLESSSNRHSSRRQNLFWLKNLLHFNSLFFCPNPFPSSLHPNNPGNHHRSNPCLSNRIFLLQKSRIFLVFFSANAFLSLIFPKGKMAHQSCLCNFCVLKESFLQKKKALSSSNTQILLKLECKLII